MSARMLQQGKFQYYNNLSNALLKHAGYKYKIYARKYIDSYNDEPIY